MFFEKCHHSDLGNSFVYLGKISWIISIELGKVVEQFQQCISPPNHNYLMLRKIKNETSSVTCVKNLLYKCNSKQHPKKVKHQHGLKSCKPFLKFW